MIFTIDVSDKEFRVTCEPRPKTNHVGEQHKDKNMQPLWSTELVVTDESGGTVISVVTVGDKPAVKLGQQVTVQDLIAIPWNSKGRSGTAYRAAAITADTEAPA